MSKKIVGIFVFMLLMASVFNVFTGFANADPTYDWEIKQEDTESSYHITEEDGIIGQGFITPNDAGKIEQVDINLDTRNFGSSPCFLVGIDNELDPEGSWLYSVEISSLVDYNGWYTMNVDWIITGNSVYYLFIKATNDGGAIRIGNNNYEDGILYIYSAGVPDPPQPNWDLAFRIYGNDYHIPEWTLMMYLDGDNNLNDAALEDINEMEVVGSTDDVQLIVLFDGNQSGDSVLYQIQHDSNGYDGIIVSTILDNLGEVNMGDPNTAINFGNWVKTNYPANRYMFEFWDHGTGWSKGGSGGVKSVCGDDTSGGDWLTTAELRTIMSALSNNGNDPIDLIGFDACLMQMIEVAYEFHEYGLFMTASEETIPWSGWKYDDTLNMLVVTPTMAPQALGAQFVNDYIANGGNTLSTIDLSLINDLRSDVSNLGAELSDYSFLDDITNSFYNMLGFNGNEYGDLFNFAQLLQNYIDNSYIDSLAQAVMDEINSIVKSEGHSIWYSDAHGISIYTPQFGYLSEYNSLRFAQDSQWDEFLIWYQDPTNNPPATPTISGPINFKPNENKEFEFGTADPDGDQVYYYVDWGDGQNSGWYGPCKSGGPFRLAHAWTGESTFTIKCKAKDGTGAESGWGTFQVSTPRNRAIYNLLLEILQRLAERFPILAQILQNLR